MTNEEFDHRIDAITTRHEALAESVELLRGSLSDLTASVHAMVRDTHERAERDRQYLDAIADLPKFWAEGRHNGHS